MGLVLLDEKQHAWDMVPLKDDDLDSSYISTKFKRILIPSKFVVYPSFKCQLPYEIVIQILQYHIDWLIRETKFTEAYINIMHVPTLLSRYYKRYCNEPLDHCDARSKPSAMLNGLYWVFEFAHCIFNDTFKKRNAMASPSIYFELSSDYRFDETSFSPRKIFNKFHVSVMDLSTFDRVDEETSTLAIRQGQNYGDIIWFQGYQSPLHSNMFEYETIERPVIILCIVDRNSNYLNTKAAKQINGWDECIRLFHDVGGENTVVYFCDSIDDEQEFAITKYQL